MKGGKALYWQAGSIVIAGLISCSAFAELPSHAAAVIAAYRNAMAGIPTDGRQIEKAFAAARRVEQVLLRSTKGTNVLDGLTADECDKLNAPGLAISCGEMQFVKADPDYFANLAEAYGDAADKGFFSTLQATYAGSWPVYVHQQTDYSGCTKFGSGKLIETYGRWRDFRAYFPNRYERPANKEFENVSSELTGSSCACGDEASLVSELERFLKENPSSTISAQVANRLRKLRAGESEIRLQCTSG